MRRTVALLVACSLSAGAAAQDAETGKAVFAQLGTLVGTWSGRSANGREQSVAFRHSAAGSVLVETWALGAGRESMTLYALDGERLLATHYCPQGNQPRLEYAGRDRDGRWQFRFVDGGNLHVAGRAHQQAFWLKFDGADAFERGETYVDNDAPAGAAEPGESVRYKRLRQD